MRRAETHAEARHRHLRQQAVYDAVKRVTAGETAYVTFAGERIQLVPFALDRDPVFALVKTRGRIRLARLAYKDGLTAVFVRKIGDYSGFSVRFPHENVLCEARTQDVP